MKSSSNKSTGDAKYFSTTKKGEIRELQDDLNSIDKGKIKEAVKKVIASMTVGKDVAMLFSDVIKSMGTDNIELKKLVYLYIINYARSQPEKAILVVNMFQKDATNHPNPLVRALAIRTMGCIRVDRIIEYLCDPLYIALKDKDPYVRKTAAICVAKLYDIQGELVEERGFIEALRNMLSDINPMVVANAVAALTEISEASGTDHFRIDNNTLSKLLTALNECTEWGRVFILDALAKFQASPAQAKDICDRVGPQLQHANSAVVMSAVKVVIQFLPQLRKDEMEKFCKKLCPPLVTLVSSTQPEIQFVALRNIGLIAQKYPRILQNEIRVFFVKFNDAVYVKMEKLDILVQLANKRNAEQVLLEFKEYAHEIDVEFVRRAVRSVGRIAIKLEAAAEKCVKVLSDLVRTKVNYVVQESVVVIKDIFRRYPRRYERIIAVLCENLEALDEPAAKSAMVWIIGEYAERIEDANERLEYFVDTFAEEDPAVQLQILTATVKLFLKRPDRAKELVQKVLNLATEKSDNPDLRDRGYVYWRLLSTDPAAAKAVVLADRPVISATNFGLPAPYLDELLTHVSSIASVFHKLPREFVRGSKTVKFTPHEVEEPDDEDEESSSSTESSEEEKEAEKRKKRRKKQKERERDREKEKEKHKKRRSRKSRREREEGEEEEEEEEENQTPADIAPVVDLGLGLGLSPPATGSAATTKAPPQQEPVDLLGGLFDEPKPEPQPQATSGALDLIDDFDPFGDGTSAPQREEGPPLTNVLTSSAGNGLSVDAGFVRKGEAPVMVARVTNGGSIAVSRIDLKFNAANYLGIQAAQTLALDGSLAAGGAAKTVDVAMSASREPVTKSPLDTTVQVAIRVGYADGGKQVFKFAVQVPPSVFLVAGNDMPQQEFLQAWRAIPPTEGQQITMKQIRTTDQNAIKGILAQKNCRFVVPREIPGRGVSLYFAGRIKDEDMLLEVSIANSGACRIIGRSKNKYLSFVSVNAISQTLQ